MLSIFSCVYYPALEKCVFRSLVHFLIGLLVFLVVSCMNFLYILENNSLSVVSFAIIFPILRKAMPKNVQTTAQLHSSPMLAK